jgi:hypothetical protein
MLREDEARTPERDRVHGIDPQRRVEVAALRLSQEFGVLAGFGPGRFGSGVHGVTSGAPPARGDGVATPGDSKNRFRPVRPRA